MGIHLCFREEGVFEIITSRLDNFALLRSESSTSSSYERAIHRPCASNRSKRILGRRAGGLFPLL